MKKLMVAAAIVVIAAFAAPALAATNPFMDVPAIHWAYDAVAQLASRGVISGYPDGSFKGPQPATRYEMASVIARVLARVDFEKASKQDVEMLKRLVVEFKDELDALAVRVDSIDERLGILETDIGGWRIFGEFRFDANFGMDAAKRWYADDMVQYGDNDFDLNRYRIFLTKRVNDTTDLTVRIGTDGNRADGNRVTGNLGMRWEQYYITTQLGYGLTLTAGRSPFNWEAGFHGTNDALVGDWAMNRLSLKKDWGMAHIEFMLGRYHDEQTADIPANVGEAQYTLVAGHARFDFTENFFGGLMGYYFLADEDIPDAAGNGQDSNLLIAGIYGGFNFTPDITLKGLFYYEDLDQALRSTTDDSANAWKIILDVQQPALRFTSLWLEYTQIDNSFIHNTGNHGLAMAVPYSFNGANLLANQPWNTGTTTVYGINTNQKWNDKWRTLAGYYVADYDTAGLDDATNWTVGVGYRLNPAVEFILTYDNIDYGDTVTRDAAGALIHNNGGGNRVDDDNMIRLRTFVTF